MNYYNDNEPFSANWLRELIKEGLIPDGEVDQRSITDIEPAELDGFTSCHFFAGIGGWPYALRLAGWPDDRPVWTGSCPCQPFSVAGKGKGLDDERHLWPSFRWLIAQRRPATIFGEQVASKDGRLWLAGVRSDLEAMGYAVGAADLCAAGIGAPHIRQRLFWVANSTCDGRRGRRDGNQAGHGRTLQIEGLCTDGGVSDSQQQGLERRYQPGHMELHRGTEQIRPVAQSGASHWQHSILIPCVDGKWRRVPGRVADATHRQARRERESRTKQGRGKLSAGRLRSGCDVSGQTCRQIEPFLQPLLDGLQHRMGDLWNDGVLEALNCFPLADGIPGRVGLLRGAGNAIVPQLASEFIESYMETKSG